MSFLLKKGIVFGKGFLYRKNTSDVPYGYRHRLLSEIANKPLSEIKNMTLFELCYVAL